MYSFGFDHVIDKNRSQVGNHLLTQHTNNTKRYLGLVVLIDPINYTVDVDLLDLYTNNAKKVRIHGVKVSADRAGSNWGEHNLPWVGQIVEVLFENGITLTKGKATVGKRFYSKVHKAPNHPLLLENNNYHQGYFTQSPGGSFQFQHPDGQTTQYNSKPNNVEGAQANARATGVGKTTAENRMDKASANISQAKASVKRLASVGNMLSTKAKQLTALAKFAARGG